MALRIGEVVPDFSAETTEGPINSFVAGPEPEIRSRFGATRYYRHQDPNIRWTIAIGELHEFWVEAKDLEPVSAADVQSYLQRR